MRSCSEQRGQRQGGFSLPELAIAVSILLVISSGAFLLFSRFAGRYQMQTAGSSAAGAARVAVNRITSEVQQAGYPSTQLVPPTTITSSLPCAVAPGFAFLQADPTTLKFQGSISPLWTGGGGSSSIACPLLQSANSLGGGTVLPVSTVTYSLDGTNLVRTVTDNTTSVTTSSNVLQNIPAGGLTFRYYCLGQASGAVDTVQTVCGVGATITASGGMKDLKTQQSFLTTIQGAAVARNVVLSSSNPNQGCDHVCSFSTP